MHLRSLLEISNVTLDRVSAAISVGVDLKAPPEAETLQMLDQLGSDWPGNGPATSTDVMAYVFGELAFAPNRGSYYSLDNSLLHRVLSRRLGNPISLAIVAIEIGRRLGVDLVPVGMPAHFLIGQRLNPRNDPDRWFDPFAAGRELNVGDAQRIFDSITPPSSEFSSLMLAATPPPLVAGRILANVRNAAVRSGDVSTFALASEMRLGVPGAGILEFRELAQVLDSSGRHDRAVEVLRWLAVNDPDNAEDYLDAADIHLAHRN